MPRVILIASLIGLLAGCVEDTMHRYDANAIKKYATVTSVTEIDNRKEFKSDSTMVAAGGVFFMINTGSPQKDGNDFMYVVQTVDGQSLSIVSKFPGFSVGECVTLFLSQTLPPRIALGGDCQ